MTQPINWSETSDKDKVRLLLEKVIGYFVLEEAAKGYSTPDFLKGTQSPIGFHWPIAFWNTDGDCWAYKDIADNGVTFFDPLHSIDAAWLIVEHIKPGRSNDAETFHIRSRFASTLDTYRLWSYPAEEVCNILCIAAIRACGIEVQS